MEHYKLGAIEIALTLARVPPVDIPFGAGLAGTPPIHAALVNAIKGAARAVSRAVRRAGRRWKRREAYWRRRQPDHQASRALYRACAQA